MAATISQLTCFTSISRHSHLQIPRRMVCHAHLLRSKFSVAMSLEEHGAKNSSLGNGPNLSYGAELSRSSTGENADSSSVVEDSVKVNIGIDETADQSITQTKRGAKIHDFCFGIPFGGFILGGGLLGFIFSRNPTSLASGVLFGGGLLGLSTTSLKVWRQGKSCLPFILGQAVLAAALCWRNIKTYSLTHKLFPSGVHAAVSAAMLCFYSYVVIAGGNPPPKKNKLSAANYTS